MKRSRNAIFKYTIVLGAAMSLSACNGIFENIYDAPDRNGDGNQGK